jgi:hypothetical protein
MVSGLAGMKILSIAVVASCLAGCYSTGDGPDPSTSLYFPVGLAVSPGGHALYVANSDFDLQFNAGTVQAYNLDNIRAFFSPIWSADSSLASSDLCDTLGLGANPTQILYPGICNALNLDAPPAGYVSMPNPNGTGDPIAKPIARSTRIGAFATDVLYACQPSDDLTMGGTSCSGSAADPRGGRLFVPVRGDPSITYIDVDDDRGDPKLQTFRLECGQDGNAGRCADSHRIGIDPGENTRGLKLPAEPFGIAISDRADAIAISHQIPGGAVSLITGTGGTVMEVKPRLEFVTGGLPAGATGITALPIPALVSALGSPTLMNYQEGFVVTYRGAAQADVFRFLDDRFAAPARPFLTRVGAFGFSATPSGIDSRSVAIDRTKSSQRVACEIDAIARAKKAPKSPDDCTDEVDCLQKANCARIPMSIFVANRVPPSLLIGDVTTPNPIGSSDTLQFYDSVPLAQGPSRVVIGKIKNAAGMLETRVFAVCFDARLIYVYDPVRRRIDGQIRTGRGPHALVMDPVEAIAYIGHFTDSYIGLIDLDQSHAGTYASVVATIGAPQPPQDSK